MTQEVIMVDPVQLFPGFMLADPSYVVTDLLICVFSIYEWAKLRRFWNRPRTIYQQLFLAYFLLMAIATLSAALLSHGFRLYLTAPAFNYPSWLLNICSLSCFASAELSPLSSLILAFAFCASSSVAGKLMAASPCWPPSNAPITSSRSVPENG